MRASWYAKAFFDLANSKTMGEEQLINHFTKTVTENGHAFMFPQILRSLKRIQEREEQKTTIEITSVAPISENEIGTILKHRYFKHAVSPFHKRVIRKTDETLVGGTVVRTGTLRVDTSYKRALLDLYTNVVHMNHRRKEDSL